MKNDSRVSYKVLKDSLNYSPDTGIFTWIIDAKSNKIKAGEKAGTKFAQGHIAIGICGKQLYAHRLAWLYMTGKFPNSEIDHINRIKDDNRWCNLRIASSGQQKYNTKKPSNNTSGIKGVHRNNSGWQGRIKVGKQYIHKTFRTIDEAAIFVRAMREIHHGEFANHG